MATEFRRMRQLQTDEAGWVSADPVLLDGEIAFSSDVRKFKVGPGQWSTLPYWSTSSGGSGTDTCPVYASRALAEAASVDPSITTIGVRQGRHILWFYANPACDALQTNEGRFWAPMGTITPHHWAENVPGITLMHNAIFKAVTWAAATSAELEETSGVDVDGYGELMAIGGNTTFDNLSNVSVRNMNLVVVAGLGATNTVFYVGTTSTGIRFYDCRIDCNYQSSAWRFDNTRHQCGAFNCYAIHMAAGGWGFRSSTKTTELVFHGCTAKQHIFSDPDRGDPAERTAYGFWIDTADVILDSCTAAYCLYPFYKNGGGPSQVIGCHFYNGSYDTPALSNTYAVYLESAPFINFTGCYFDAGCVRISGDAMKTDPTAGILFSGCHFQLASGQVNSFVEVEITTETGVTLDGLVFSGGTINGGNTSLLPFLRVTTSGTGSLGFVPKYVITGLVDEDGNGPHIVSPANDVRDGKWEDISQSWLRGSNRLDVRYFENFMTLGSPNHIVLETDTAGDGGGFLDLYSAGSRIFRVSSTAEIELGDNLATQKQMVMGGNSSVFWFQPHENFANRWAYDVANGKWHIGPYAAGTEVMVRDDVVQRAAVTGDYPTPSLFRDTLEPYAMDIRHLGLIPNNLLASGDDNRLALQAAIDWLTAKTNGGTIFGQGQFDKGFNNPIYALDAPVRIKPKVSFNFDRSVHFRAAAAMTSMVWSSEADLLSGVSILGGTWSGGNLADCIFDLRQMRGLKFGGMNMRLVQGKVNALRVGHSSITSGSYEFYGLDFYVTVAGTRGAGSESAIKAMGNISDSRFRNLVLQGYPVGVNGAWFGTTFDNVHAWSFAGGEGALNYGFRLDGGQCFIHNCQIDAPAIAAIEIVNTDGNNRIEGVRSGGPTNASVDFIRNSTGGAVTTLVSGCYLQTAASTFDFLNFWSGNRSQVEAWGNFDDSVGYLHLPNIHRGITETEMAFTWSGTAVVVQTQINATISAASGADYTVTFVVPQNDIHYNIDVTLTHTVGTNPIVPMIVSKGTTSFRVQFRDAITGGFVAPATRVTIKVT